MRHFPAPVERLAFSAALTWSILLAMSSLFLSPMPPIQLCGSRAYISLLSTVSCPKPSDRHSLPSDINPRHLYYRPYGTGMDSNGGLWQLECHRCFLLGNQRSNGHRPDHVSYTAVISISIQSDTDPLCRVNVNDMKLYQQLAIYFIPIIGNMVFINMTVVVVRLGLFERRIKQLGDFDCF